MKRLSVLHFGIAALALCFSAAAHAQTETLVFGRANLTLTPSLLGNISGAGAVVTDLAGNPLVSGASPFQLNGGYIDLQTGVAEGIGRGGFQISRQGQTLRAQDFIYSNLKTGQNFTANIVLNGTALGRFEVFRFASVAPGPVQLQNGVLQFANDPFNLSPSLVQLIQSTFGINVSLATIPAGTLSEYLVYVPDTAGLQSQ